MKRVCIPCTRPDLENLSDILPREYGSQPYIEIYVDFLNQASLENLPSFCTASEHQLILTFRRPGFSMQRLSLSERKKIIAEICQPNVLFDFDIEREIEELSFLSPNARSLSLIASYHSYDRTPSYNEFLGLLQKMQAVTPAYVKFASLCQGDDDCITLMKLLMHLRESDLRYIVTGMGEKGKVVRLAGAINGNAWSYVSSSADAQTAPGQYTFEAFTELMELLAPEQ